MTRKQLILLFMCYLLPSTVGSSIMAVMSLYARTLGADAAQTGLFLAIAFALLAITTIGSSSLSGRFGRRKLFIIAPALLNAPLFFLMGTAQDVVQLGLLTTLGWGLFGISTSMLTILTGLFADDRSRGRTFGVMGVALALGQVIGGLVSGALVDRWGFPALFTFSAALWLLLAVIALGLADKQTAKAAPASPAAARQTGSYLLTQTGSYAAVQTGTFAALRSSAPLGGAFLLILAASVMAFSGNFVGEMVRPLAMDANGFSTSEITGAVAFAGLINLPLPFVMGWLSDRIGRRGVLYTCYTLAAVGVALMIPATAAWHFWIAAALIALVNSGFAIGSALVTEMAPPSALESSLARFAATRWIGAVVSFAGAGMAVQVLGVSLTLALTMVLVFAAVPVVRLALSPRRALATS
ncbi:MAG: MFS transporter [Chloroflexi bacterium]|nr:MFS transporter [Chloroflexota bacterium]